MRFHVQAIALLVMTASWYSACVPLNTSKKSDDSAAKSTQAEETKRFVWRETAGVKDGYDMVFSTTKFVEKMWLCDERAKAPCGPNVPSFIELTHIEKKNVEGKLFYNKGTAIRLVNGTILSVFTKKEGDPEFKLSRYLEVSDKKWAEVRTAMRTGCAGAACHYLPDPNAKHDKDNYSETHEIFIKNSAAIFDRLSKKTMPPAPQANQLSDANRTLIMDYAKAQNPTMSLVTLTKDDAMKVVMSGCAGVGCHVAADGFVVGAGRVDLTTHARLVDSKLRVKIKMTLSGGFKNHGVFRTDDERAKFVAFIQSL